MGMRLIITEEEKQRIKNLYEDIVDTEESVETVPTNIVIGDSQTPYVDAATTKASRISTTGGKSSLWLGGMGVNWLKDAVNSYPTVNNNVKNVVTVIGTNGDFGKVFGASEDIAGLFAAIHTKFPNATILVVQGSWGWGKMRSTEQDVRTYYKKYSDLGGILIEPPIGNVEPHGSRPVYTTIGAAIDAAIG